MSDNKQQLRQQCLEKRAALDAGYRQIASRVVTTHILSLLPAGKIVAGYHAIKGEMDISILMRVLAEKGFTTCLPVAVEKGTPLVFRQWKSGDRVAKGQYGENIPTDTAPVIVPDIVLVPLLAFNEDGYRLGYGCGYYDRTLAQLKKQNPKLITLGVAFSSQYVENIPLDAHDYKLDAIITETTVVKIA